MVDEFTDDVVPLVVRRGYSLRSRLWRCGAPWGCGLVKLIQRVFEAAHQRTDDQAVVCPKHYLHAGDKLSFAKMRDVPRIFEELERHRYSEIVR